MSLNVDLSLHVELNRSGGKPGTDHVLEHLRNPAVLNGMLSTDVAPVTPQAGFVRSTLGRDPISRYNFIQATKRVYAYPSLIHKMTDSMAFTVGRAKGFGALMIGILNADEERTLELLVRRKLGHPWDSGDRPRALPLIQAIRLTVFVMSRPDVLSRRQMAKLAGITHPTLNKMIGELQPVLQSIADEGAAVAAQKIAA
jgi:hypothetical protein